jgi:ketosteroid isomerase-like protein
MRAMTSSKHAIFLAGALLLSGCGNNDRAQPPAADPAAPAEPAAAVVGKEDPAADTAADEAALIQLERDYAKALIAKDRDFLMRFYAADWQGGNWMGFWKKATMLKSVLGARYVIKSMELRDMKVRVMGDVAIVQGVDEEVTSVDGSDTSGKWTFTDVFARRDGQWVAIASHTSEVKPTE